MQGPRPGACSIEHVPYHMTGQWHQLRLKGFPFATMLVMTLLDIICLDIDVM